MTAELLLSLPFIVALTAYATAWGMLKFMLYPVMPIRISGIRLQGFLPSHIHSSAGELATMVAKAIVAAAHKNQILTNNASVDAMRPLLEAHLDAYLRIRLKEKLPVIASFIGESTIIKLKDSMIEEIDSLLPQVIEQYVSSALTVTALQPRIKNALTALEPSVIEAAIAPFLLQARARIPFICGVAGLCCGILVSVLFYVLLQLV